MVENLKRVYLQLAVEVDVVDYGDMDAVLVRNSKVDRMRTIIDEVVALGEEAVQNFATLLDDQYAGPWAAHNLVEKAELDPITLAKCFAIVEEALQQAERENKGGTAMGEQIWLREWKVKKGL